MADGDGLDELSQANVNEYLAVKVLFCPALTESLIHRYERYRKMRWEEGKPWIGLTAFIETIMIRGLSVFDAVLEKEEARLGL